ncbi:unnamed protein product [Meloidogyne enterolobii]|uniref:Uncharacterized protein n=1 Tax=Meloidogyne enterolobii TaxID=390850 RepID=A0ACB0YSW0_MELEN
MRLCQRILYTFIFYVFCTFFSKLTMKIFRFKINSLFKAKKLVNNYIVLV